MSTRIFRAFFLLAAAPLLSQCGAHTSVPLTPNSYRSITAMTLTTSNVSGPIVALITGGFEIQGGSACGYVHIYTNSLTVFIPTGAQPAVGMNAQVTGTGGCATSVTATQVTLSSVVAKHVNTGAYLYSADGVTAYGRPFSAYSSSLTWAETYSGTAVLATGIKTLLYTNPNREETTDPLFNADETTFAHDCTGARITQKSSTNTTYLMNPNSSDLITLYNSYVSNKLLNQNFTAILDDEPFDWYSLTAMPCNYVASTWFNAYANEMTNLPRPAIYNGLGNQGPNNTVSQTIQFNSVAIGGMMESCYSASWNPHLSYGAQWQGIENTEIAMAQQNKLLICISNNGSTASTAVGMRLYVYASYLLTYDPSTTSLWEFFDTTSHYRVEPESQLVATAPVTASPSSITALQTASGVFARQYTACYIAGKSVGPCAAVVNPDYQYSHAFPFTTYHHTLLLTGGGILDGGTISTAGPAPATNMAPLSGVIAFQ